ncbi:MAG: hypothetical protein R6W06_08245 [Prochlorococcaceae cyanobacterium]
MHADSGFKHRLVEHLEVVVVVAYQGLSLDELGRQPDLDPLLNLLTLPVRAEAERPASNQQILRQRLDLLSAVLTVMFERFPTLTPEELMVIVGIPTIACIQALLLDQLEALAVGEAFCAGVALLDFTNPADLAACLAEYTG